MYIVFEVSIDNFPCSNEHQAVKSHIVPKVLLRISKIWRSSLCYDFDEIILLDQIHKQNK